MNGSIHRGGGRLAAVCLAWLLPAVGALAQVPEFTTHPAAPSFEGAIECALADLDLDGDLDLGAVGYDGDTVAWLENDGSENFTVHVIGTPDGPRSLSMVGPDGGTLDLDGDGDGDIVATGFLAGDVLWYENDGAMNFTEHAVDDNLVNAHTVVAGDLDGDGDLDLAATSNNAVWYENDGSQNFTRHYLTSHPYLGCSMQIVDFDHDGDLDLIEVIEGTWTNVIWWENDGAGGFTEHDLVSGYPNAHTGFAVDMDADGDMDLVTCSWDPGRFSWWVNLGDFSFMELVVDTECAYNFWIEPADLDNDGDLDLLGAATGCGVVWYERTDLYAFVKRDVDGTFGGAFCARAGDIDGDGDLDAVAASRSGDAVIWCEQVSLSAVGDPDAPTAGHGSLRLEAAPNPFNPSTTISYEMGRAEHVRVEVVDLRGRVLARLVDGRVAAGHHDVTWRPGNLPSGTYFCRLTTADRTGCRKLLLLK